MRKLTEAELIKEFSQIILTKKSNTHLDNTDLKRLIESSTNKTFFYISLEIKIDIDISFEEIKKLKKYTMYLVQFRINPQCRMLNVSKIIDMINDILDEDSEIIFTTKKDIDYRSDAVEVKVFTTY